MTSGSSTAGPEPADGRLTNLVGAWSLAVADRVAAAAEAAAGSGGRTAAALVALHEFAGGRTLEDLRDVLGFTHSAAVRLADNLVLAGYLVRGSDPDDGRAVALTLTAAGRAAARRVVRARREAIEATLAQLSTRERRALEVLVARLTADITALRLAERREGTLPPNGWLCRLCDLQACGRPDGRCPAVRHAPPR